jgi:HisA/HisF family protein
MPEPPRFRTIPVLDIKGGAVVRARGGDRANYRPIVTPLAEGSAPEAVLAGLLRLAPFTRIYIADLDAIERGAPQHDTVATLAAGFPSLEFWLDAGFRGPAAGLPPRCRPVLGTETLRDLAELREAVVAHGAAGCVLSLDFRGEGFLGNPAILATPGSWPTEVIAMTLHSVGGGTGPDLARLAALRSIHRGRIHAAGGVRNAADLQRLVAMGIAGALVATALHDGHLGAADLTGFV